jgi:hypothetical protein
MRATCNGSSRTPGLGCRATCFGARVDGTTDDSAAYQAAIDALAGKGGDILVDAGTSLVKGLVLASGVALVGAAGHGFRGMGSRLKAAGPGTMISVPGTATNTGIHGISFWGHANAQPGDAGVAISIDGDFNIVSNCTFFSLRDQAIVLGPNSTACKVVDCYGYSCVQNTARTQVTGALEVRGTDHYLETSQFGCGYSALSFPAPTADLYVCGVALLGANCFVNAVHGEYVACDGDGFVTAKYLLADFLGASPEEPAVPIRPADVASWDTTGTTFVLTTAYTVPTTVTAIDGGFAGKEIRVLSTNELVTIANNATIRTSSLGASKKLGRDAVYRFVWYPGVWYEAAEN